MSQPIAGDRRCPPALPAVTAGTLSGRCAHGRLLWVALVVLLVAVQALLLGLTLHYRSARRRKSRRRARQCRGTAQMLGRPAGDPEPARPRGRAAALASAAHVLLIERPELLRLERRDTAFALTHAMDTRAARRCSRACRVPRRSSRPSSLAERPSAAANRAIRAATSCRMRMAAESRCSTCASPSAPANA